MIRCSKYTPLVISFSVFINAIHFTPWQLVTVLVFICIHTLAVYGEVPHIMTCWELMKQ